MMSPMIPDCGIFATPRREPPLKVLADDVNSSPCQSTTPLNSPKLTHLPHSPDSPELSGITLSSGFSFGFYKSPKHLLSPPPKIDPLLAMKTTRRPRDGINKGVGHKIKKPSMKAKEKLKKRNTVKAITKRLKERTYIPRLPSTRSPLKPSVSKVNKKRRTLSSPGISYLHEEEIGDFMPQPSSAKFFTSKSRAAATVQIGKTIKLSAKYGDVTLKQRGGAFIKKNIGRLIEDELHQYLEHSTNSSRVEESHSLPSMLVNPRPAPTRVPGTPSPSRKPLLNRRQHTPSPRKEKKNEVTTKTKTNMSNSSLEGELLDMEKILDEWDNKSSRVEDDCGSPVKSTTNKSLRKIEGMSTPTRSPSKAGETGTPTRRSLRKLSEVCYSLTRSPRKLRDSSPSRRTSRKLGVCISPARSPMRKKECGTPTRLSPRKEASSSARKSPEICSSPYMMCEKRMTPSRTKDSQDSSKATKMFPIFDPKKRLADQIVPGSSGKSTARSSTKMIAMENDSQMILDAGQKKFGAEQCSLCGVVYEIGNPSDEASHKSHHDRFLNSLNFRGWKKENVVRSMDYEGGRVIMVSGDDPEYSWRKVDEIREIIDNELGFAENWTITRESTKVFLKILDQRIVGCLIAERISIANRVIPQKSQEQGQGPLVCCSEATTKVWAGVSRLWVLQSQRGKHIASTLVDTMRENMIPYFILTVDQIAFSDPTENGMMFAEKYTGKPDFLVYRRIV